MTITVTDRATWLTARNALLKEEKAFNKLRDELNVKRRALPVVRLDKPYVFETPAGNKTIADLFGDKDQLVVYHFMFGRDWSQGCPSCSFWADNLNGTMAHLAARNTAFVCVSTASLATLLAYRSRMGWSFDWVSSGQSDFNQDFGVTFVDGNPGPTGGYNYRNKVFGEEMPGISIFVRLEDGGVGHSYSTYSRGLDLVNGAYNLLDLTPAGRNESDLPFTQAWVKRHDEYSA